MTSAQLHLPSLWPKTCQGKPPEKQIAFIQKVASKKGFKLHKIKAFYHPSPPTHLQQASPHGPLTAVPSTPDRASITEQNPEICCFHERATRFSNLH